MNLKFDHFISLDEFEKIQLDNLECKAEYNNGEMQNFEIEMDWILGDKEDENQNLIPVLQPKLTNNFITSMDAK